MRRHTSLFSLLALLIGFIAVGCGEDPVGPDPDPDPNDSTEIWAGLGTTYVYDYHQIDSVGGIVAGSQDTAVFVFIDSTLSLDGRSDVYRFDETRGGNVREHYLHPLGNGNVEFKLALREPIDFDVPDFWALFPFGSKATTSQVILDSLFTETFVGDVKVTAVVKSMYVGQENVTIGGETIKVEKGRVELTVHLDALNLADEFEVIEITEISYAPQLGYVSTRTFTSEDDLENHRVDKEGESYTLKSVTFK